MAFQKGQGGRKPGSKNKLTLLKAKLRDQAMKTMNEALGEDAFKGDGVEFLQAIYKNPNFDFEIRMEAATRVAQFERAKKSESTIEDKREYVVRMPPPSAGQTTDEQLKNWLEQYSGTKDDEPKEEQLQ